MRRFRVIVTVIVVSMASSIAPAAQWWPMSTVSTRAPHHIDITRSEVSTHSPHSITNEAAAASTTPSAGSNLAVGTFKRTRWTMCVER
jgi:hypothetical protein